ncbi:MAG TPA: class I SAM-dependent methyltransferase [Candidatus Methylomirabilis sp.]|nr:class I SAM-dependent methyltransferase [Candidatus Methylomirabilis sp.]
MAWTWQSGLLLRTYRPGEGSPDDHAPLTPTFLRLALAEVAPGTRVVDLGCGAGRVALALARAGGLLVGLDSAARAVAAARAAAARDGLSRARFLHADVETADLPGVTGWAAADLAVAHFCYSGRLLAHAAGFLRPGGAIVCAAIHPDQWRETGRPSRFAVAEAEVEAHAAAAALLPEAASRETERLRFSGWEEARAYLGGAALWDRWAADGRGEALRAAFAAGRRTLTVRSTLLFTLRRA